jgi:hypothetical protein
LVAIHLPSGPQGDDWHGSNGIQNFVFYIKDTLNLLLASVHRVPFHSGKQWQRKPFSKSVHVPLFAHGYERHSSNSKNREFNYKLRFFFLFLIKLPWLHVGPIKPGSHWQVNELDTFGIQVPCLLQTSGVHTTWRININFMNIYCTYLEHWLNCLKMRREKIFP